MILIPPGARLRVYLLCLLIHWVALWLRPLPIHSHFHLFIFSTRVKIYFSILSLGWRLLRWSFYVAQASLKPWFFFVSALSPKYWDSRFVVSHTHPRVSSHLPSIINALISPIPFAGTLFIRFFSLQCESWRYSWVVWCLPSTHEVLCSIPIIRIYTLYIYVYIHKHIYVYIHISSLSFTF